MFCKLIAFLVAYILATSCTAEGNDESLGTFFGGVQDVKNFYLADDNAFLRGNLVPRHETVMVTVTETVCEPAFTGTSTFITVPATSVGTETSVDSTTSVTELPPIPSVPSVPSVPSETYSTPTTEPTTSYTSSVTSQTSEISVEPTTSYHSVSTSQTSGGATEAPTNIPTSTPIPLPNVAFPQEKAYPALLALIVTFVAFVLV